jgi:hypothetical protein
MFEVSVLYGKRPSLLLIANVRRTPQHDPIHGKSLLAGQLRSEGRIRPEKSPSRMMPFFNGEVTSALQPFFGSAPICENWPE